MNILQIAARISAVCVESKIRHKDPGNKFDLNEFKSLPSREVLKYAEDRLQQIGRGSSRAVFLLSSSKVLKIAVRHGMVIDVYQNRSEVSLYTDPKTKQICAKIFDFDPDYVWLISELVRPVSAAEFKNITGVDSKELEHFGECLEDGLSPEEIYEQYSEDNKIRDVKSVPKDKFDEWIYLFENLVSQGVYVGELTRSEHWGVTSSGNLVVLDYGIVS